MNSIDKTKQYATIEIRSLDKLISVFRYLRGNWIFRGHSNADYDLETPLERQYRRHNKGGKYKVCINELEELMAFAFKRRQHHYFDSDEISYDKIDQCSLMQHSGIPTRLLDWTKSPYVAAYFATRMHDNRYSAVWAINLDDIVLFAKIKLFHYINKKLSYRSDLVCKLKRDIDYEINGVSGGDGVGVPVPMLLPYHKINTYLVDDKEIDLINSNELGVFPVFPNRLNKRILSQQALFLRPGRLGSGETFITNLIESYRVLKESGMRRKSPVIKIVIDNELQQEIRSELNLYNINGYSLFHDSAGLTDWFNEVFVPQEVGEDSATKFFCSSFNIDLFNKLRAFVGTTIHFDAKIPNVCGASANIYNVMKDWHVNIEHSSVRDVQYDFDSISIDGTIDWKNEKFIDKIVNDKCRCEFSSGYFNDYVNKEETDVFLRKRRRNDSRYNERYKREWNDNLKEIFLNGDEELREIIKSVHVGCNLHMCLQVATDYVRLRIKKDLLKYCCHYSNFESCTKKKQCKKQLCLKKECKSVEMFNRINKSNFFKEEIAVDSES